MHGLADSEERCEERQIMLRRRVDAVSIDIPPFGVRGVVRQVGGGEVDRTRRGPVTRIHEGNSGGSRRRRGGCSRRGRRGSGAILGARALAGRLGGHRRLGVNGSGRGHHDDERGCAGEHEQSQRSAEGRAKHARRRQHSSLTRTRETVRLLGDELSAEQRSQRDQ